VRISNFCGLQLTLVCRLHSAAVAAAWGRHPRQGCSWHGRGTAPVVQRRGRSFASWPLCWWPPRDTPSGAPSAAPVGHRRESPRPVLSLDPCGTRVHAGRGSGGTSPCCRTGTSAVCAPGQKVDLFWGFFSSKFDLILIKIMKKLDIFITYKMR
jgi:hypothetical protein